MVTAVKNMLGRWAGIQPTPDRAYVVAPVQDAHKDFTSHDRTQFAAKVREMERNDAFVNRILDLHDIYVFGASGLQFRSASTDSEWGALADELFSDWCEHPDIGSVIDFATVQKLIGGSWGLDGGAFAILTEDTSERGFIRPRVQLIEDHRCATPPAGADTVAGGKVSPEQAHACIDGIEVNPVTLRPLAYWFYGDGARGSVPVGRNSFLSVSKVWMRIEAESVVHFTSPRRIGELRSPSMFYAVLNDIQDLGEWQHFVKLKLKDTAETSKVLYTKDGARNMDNLQARFAAAPAQSPSETLEERVGKLRRILGARTVNLSSSDRYEEFKSDQPADTSQRFWEIVARRACAGVNIPYEVVFPASIQGTMARAVFDMAHAHFSGLQAMFAVGFKRIWRHVILTEARSNRRLADMPSDWRRVSVTGPRAINVDIGYNSRAAIDEIEAGLRTYDEVYTPKGGDVMQALRANAKVIKAAGEIETEFGIPTGSLLRAMNRQQPPTEAMTDE
jgi:capsid protein